VSPPPQSWHVTVRRIYRLPSPQDFPTPTIRTSTYFLSQLSTCPGSSLLKTSLLLFPMEMILPWCSPLHILHVNFVFLRTMVFLWRFFRWRRTFFSLPESQGSSFPCRDPLDPELFSQRFNPTTSSSSFRPLTQRLPPSIRRFSPRTVSSPSLPPLVKNKPSSARLKFAFMLQNLKRRPLSFLPSTIMSGFHGEEGPVRFRVILLPPLRQSKEFSCRGRLQTLSSGQYLYTS